MISQFDKKDKVHNLVKLYMNNQQTQFTIIIKTNLTNLKEAQGRIQEYYDKSNC